MNNQKRGTGNQKQPVKTPTMPRDLPDFHVRWPEFRSCAEALMKNPSLNAGERELVGWLVKLADRVGPQDLHAE
jgi:hypothetical protein